METSKHQIRHWTSDFVLCLLKVKGGSFWSQSWQLISIDDVVLFAEHRLYK
jgi:hypothetical protein